eukprot:XP_017946091.1 PREDICTED: uncharacterized protein LOC101731448 isoform X2 [Xenopus tropicalis]
MATNLDEMLARIRAEAERRGDDWLRQFLPSLEDPQPTTPTRRPRRARPPTRLSPSPPVRRRRPTSPSPQPSTSRSSGRSRGTGGKGPTPSTPPTRQKDPDTPTGRPRGGGMATRQRGGGPDARDDDVTGATSGASGTPTRLRRQASTGSREGGSAIRAGQAEAPGPRGARGAGARERRRVGGPVGGEAGAREAAQGGGGETAVAQATGGTAQPQTRSGPAIQQSWAPVATQERGGGMEAAQAAWHAAGADVARSQMGACGPATRLAGAQEMPSMAQAAWVPTRPGPGPTGNPMGAGGLLTATRESGAMAGSPCYRPLQTPGQQAGPTGNGQESQQGWAPAPTGEANRAVPMGAAAGREGATAAHSVAAQGMPPPLCLQQVQGPGNGEGGTPQQQQGITPGAPGRDSTTTNYNNSAVEQVPGASAGSGAGGRAVPRPCMESGASGMMEWVRRSVALKTWNDYNRTWEEWFHLEREMGGVETNTEKLGLLAWQLSRDFEAQVSISVVEKKLAALAFLFKFKGWPDFTKDFAIKQAVKGFKKGKKSTDHRRPITFNILGGLFDQLGVLANSPFEITLFKLAFSWAFFGAFRISELVSHNRAGNGGILARDVIRSEGSVSILIRDSKTDKQRKGFRVELFGIQGHHTCPVSCFDSYYSMRPDQQGSLMIHQDGSSLSRYQFIAILKRALKGLQLAGKEYGSHSFRIGAATEAARWGLGADVIRRIGRWESNRFKAYVRPARVER